MPRQKVRTDLRTVKAPMHQQAAWSGNRGPEAEKKRRDASTRAQQKAAANRQLATLAVDVFAKLLPDTQAAWKKRKS